MNIHQLLLYYVFVRLLLYIFCLGKAKLKMGIPVATDKMVNLYLDIHLN